VKKPSNSLFFFSKAIMTINSSSSLSLPDIEGGTTHKKEKLKNWKYKYWLSHCRKWARQHPLQANGFYGSIADQTNFTAQKVQFPPNLHGDISATEALLPAVSRPQPLMVRWLDW
jgi:hypothetical protein